MNSPDAALDRRRAIGFGMLIALLLLVIASKTVLYDSLDPDSFWHLRVAAQLEREGIHPLIDNLSFASAKQPWTPYSWLAELGMKTIWDVGGYRAAIAVQAVVIALIFGFIALIALEMTSDVRQTPRPFMAIALSIVFAAYLALPYLSFRPVTASILLLAIIAWLIARDRRLEERSRLVWLVPVLTAININVHLFALVAPIWMAALLVGAMWERHRASGWTDWKQSNQNIRRYAMLFAACTLACLATPMLRGMIETISHYGRVDPMVASQAIAELRPFYTGSMAWITGAVLLAAAVAMFLRRDSIRAGDWLMLLIGTIGLFKMGRLAPLFVLSAAPLLALSLPMLQGKLLARTPVHVLLGLTVLAGAARVFSAFPGREVSLSQWANRNGPSTPGFPCSAADFVATNIAPDRGRIINDFNWGGYLAWRLGPQFQIYMDARTQLYSPTFWQQTCLGDEQALSSAIRSVRADAAIVPINSKRLGVALQQNGWREVFADDRATVMVPGDSSVADTRDQDH